MQKHPLNPLFVITGIKNILQHQQFVESLAELLEHIQIPFTSDGICCYFAALF